MDRAGTAIGWGELQHSARCQAGYPSVFPEVVM